MIFFFFFWNEISLFFSTSLELKRGKERGFCVFWNEGEGGLYSSGGENMNGKPFNEG